MMRLSEQIRGRLFDHEMTQSQLAKRLQRPPARISELLRGLDRGDVKQDRLTLVQDIAEALQMELVLAPREKLDEITRILGPARDASMSLQAQPSSMFDELFIDLGDEDDVDEDRR